MASVLVRFRGLGGHPEGAVYYPDDEKFLLELEPEVRH
jgi:hypothetical protein